MKQSYIESFLNAEGDIVIHYISDAQFGEDIELQSLIVRPVDTHGIIAALMSAMNNMPE